MAPKDLLDRNGEHEKNRNNRNSLWNIISIVREEGCVSFVSVSPKAPSRALTWMAVKLAESTVDSYYDLAVGN